MGEGTILCLGFEPGASASPRSWQCSGGVVTMGATTMGYPGNQIGPKSHERHEWSILEINIGEACEI